MVMAIQPEKFFSNSTLYGPDPEILCGWMDSIMRLGSTICAESAISTETAAAGVHALSSNFTAFQSGLYFCASICSPPWSVYLQPPISSPELISHRQLVSDA